MFQSQIFHDFPSSIEFGCRVSQQTMRLATETWAAKMGVEACDEDIYEESQCRKPILYLLTAGATDH